MESGSALSVEEYVMVDDASTIHRLASACAERVPGAPRTLHDDAPAFEHELDELLAAIRASHERFAFDAAGRPAAIVAIRNALPTMEAELLDAVLDDLACETAARQEALYRIALAARTRSV